MNCDSEPFNGIFVARGVTIAALGVSGCNCNNFLSQLFSIVLYSQNAYDWASIVIRLAYKVYMNPNSAIPRFKKLAMVDVPRSRNGKHKKIVTAILRNLDDLAKGVAFKIPLADLGDIKENVRSALNRATRKSDREVATATDENFLYVWNVAKLEQSDGVRPNGQSKLSRIARQA